MRKVYNTGYSSKGKFKTCIKGKHTKSYSVWEGMLRRCYTDGFENYKDCSVCEEWHDFQNFAKWYNDNYYEVENERMELDKDILNKGNKIYSPQNCIIVTNHINSLFTKNKKQRGNLPIGVRKAKYGRYKAVCRNGNKRYEKYFETIDEAFKCYKNMKENVIKEVAETYKDKIPNKLYEAMHNYKVGIDD